MQEIPFFENDKQLFDYVRKIDLNTFPALEEIFSTYNFKNIQINELEEILYNDNTLLIDTRSEKEYAETAIPCAINFPVLNIQERHNVGLIYKKYSQKASEYLAIKYAEQKVAQLKKTLVSSAADKRNIIVYCWRGGGRSKYLAKMISDLGYDISVLTKGFKSYRNNIVNYFNLKHIPIKFLELRGMTGCGKTEILRKLMFDLPVIDLEDAARHYSSLFGSIPFIIRGILPVLNQSAFENNIYSQFLYNKLTYPEIPVYLIESESKKVGDFRIPENIYTKIESSQCVNIHASLSSRVKRIETDYFKTKEKGIQEMLNILTLKEKFFRKEMSNKFYDSAQSVLKKGNTSEFCEIMLTKYYDNKYRVKDKNPIANICSDNINEASEEIREVFQRQI
jgi:tRNA 2-selenouridine synthase